MVEKDQLNDYDHLIHVYYLLLQDRIEDSITVFKNVKREKIDAQLQYDYVAAYSDILNDGV